MWSDRFSSRFLSALALGAALAMPSVAFAVTITGVVKTEGAVAIGNVDIDFIDLCSGANVFLASDHTAADGTFNITIAAGTYDIHFIPPAGSTVCAGDMQEVVVSANASLGTVTLHPGRLVSGTVLTPSLTPAANVDIKWLIAPTNQRVFLSKTLTDASGNYAIRVPPGTWNLDYRPAATTTFADVERLGLVVGASDISGLSNTLKTGFVVTGSVRTKSGNLKISNVDVSFFDDCTGLRVPTAHDNSDINGNFSVVVPAGTYTFTCAPPACAGVEASHATGVVISGAASMGTIALGAAVLVSGIVHGPSGLPLFDAKIKFYDATVVGTPRQGAARDHTDANGAFSIQVPPGTYDLNIDPPAGLAALVFHISGLVVGGGANIGTVQLSPGLALSGHVQGPGGTPQLYTNINVLDHATHTNQHLANDRTDANGNFTVYVNPGVWDVHYDPAACGGMAPMQQESLTVAANLTLPTMNVTPGVHLLGTVTDAASAPAAGVSIDVFPAGGAVKLYTPGAKTTATGAYDAFIPQGTYDIHYFPPALVRWRPAQRPSLTVVASQTLPVTVLANGWFVSGTVRNRSTLAPLLGVTLEFYPNNQLPVAWTPHHVTDSFGAYNVSVDAGTYDIRFVPAAGSGYAESWLHRVSVGADLPLADVLLAPPSAGVGPGAQPGLSLAAPTPNPAHRHVSLTFAAPAGEAELTAWDITGRQVATLWHGHSLSPVTVQWDGARSGGGNLPSGIYLIRLADSHGASQLRRVTLLQ